MLVAEADDRVGESCSLLWGVDLLVDGGERVPAPVGVVLFDRFAQSLEVGADQVVDEVRRFGRRSAGVDQRSQRGFVMALEGLLDAGEKLRDAVRRWRWRRRFR